MDTVTVYLNELEKIESGKVYKYNGETYYSLERIKFLSDLVRKNGAITDLVITPYYFFDKQVIELYDYTLSIRIVDRIQPREQFLLEETGKKNVEEIDTNIIEKLDHTYYEVLDGDTPSFIISLERYTNFMSENESNLLIKTRDEINIHVNTNDGIYYELF